MKVTLREIKDATESLSKVLGSPRSTTGAYRLSKLTGRCMAEAKHIEKARVKLVKQYGKENEQGIFEVPPKNSDKFLEEFDKFLETEIELENVNAIPFAMLSGLQLTAIDMAHLEKFVVPPTDEELQKIEEEEKAEEERKAASEVEEKPPRRPAGKK